MILAPFRPAHSPPLGLLTNGKAKEALAKRIADARFRVVIADEAHYLKNADSQRSKLLLPIIKVQTPICDCFPYPISCAQDPRV
eukprot:SAG11_NODE_5312_length_1599_cov_4.756667_2_plen_84_part_00